MSGNTTPYTNLITSEHQDKPNFMAMVAMSVQPWADLIYLYGVMNGYYDIDQAVGAQLDVIGQHLGVSRYLSYPVAGIYFSFDDPNLGFDQGYWQGSNATTEGQIVLDDATYLILLKVRIQNNHWDGTKQGAYDATAPIYNALGYQLFIVDNGDLSIQIGLLPLTPPPVALTDSSGNPVTGYNPISGQVEPVYASPAALGPPPTIVRSLLASGDLDFKPATIRINGYLFPSQTGPMFAFDMSNSNFDGFDNGAWATVINNPPPDPGQWLFGFDSNQFPIAGFDLGNWSR